MKQEARKWLARAVFVALVAIGTLIAAPRLAQARCGYPSPGTCPPLEGYGPPGQGYSCPDACDALGWHDGGDCLGNGCCVCRM